MASSTQSIGESLVAWKDGCLSNGHRLAYGEHRCILLAGEKIDADSRPAGIPDHLWKIVEGVQLDPLPGVEQIAKLLGVSALELAFYRTYWGALDDEVLKGVVNRRVLVSRSQGVPDQVIQDFIEEVDRWTSRIREAGRARKHDLPDSMRVSDDASPS